jgi:hypothetical protein
VLFAPKNKKKLEDLRGKVEGWENGMKGVETDPMADMDSVAKGVANSDAKWEGSVEDGDEYVILTHSNGAGVTQDTVKCHIPKDMRDKYRIRVATTYTLFEVFEKIRDGSIKVEKARVILDVTTNDI